MSDLHVRNHSVETFTGLYLPMPARLLQSEVHVWLCTYDHVVPADLVHARLLDLSSDELDRHARYTHDDARIQFLLGRSLLRRRLSAYFPHMLPQDWCFDHTTLGKPMLSTRHGIAPLHFNISHCEGIVAVAFSGIAPTGIDVEPYTRRGQLECIMRLAFTAREREQLQADQTFDALVRHWTKKEALLKAIGCGLSLAPHRLELLCTGHDAGRVWLWTSDDDTAYAWSLALHGKLMHPDIVVRAACSSLHPLRAGADTSKLCRVKPVHDVQYRILDRAETDAQVSRSAL